MGQGRIELEVAYRMNDIDTLGALGVSFPANGDIAVLSGLVGLLLSSLLTFIPIEFIAKAFELVPALEGIGTHVPNFIFGGLGGLLVGKLLFGKKTEKVVQAAVEKAAPGLKK